MSEEFRKDYPLKTEGEYASKCLGGIDIYRSDRIIEAVLATEKQGGFRDLRFYRWQKRKDKVSGQEMWKVDLARFSVRRIDFMMLAERIEKLRTTFGIPVA